MTDSGNFALHKFLRRELESWQSQYYRDVYSLFEQDDGQQLFIALEHWEEGFRTFLRDRFPRLVNEYDTQTTPSIPLTQTADAIQIFKPYKSDQIEAFLAKSIEDAGNGNLDQYYVTPDSIETTSPLEIEEVQAVKVFISYSHQDKSFVKKLAGELEGQDMKVWWDFDSLKGGQDWQKEIELGIKQCDFFIIVLTPQAVESEWVNKEVTYANEYKKMIIPILLKDCERPISIIEKQYIDFEKQTQKEAIKELLGILKM